MVYNFNGISINNSKTFEGLMQYKVIYHKPNRLFHQLEVQRQLIPATIGTADFSPRKKHSAILNDKK